jgi:uncharacterized membrane protein
MTAPDPAMPSHSHTFAGAGEAVEVSKFVRYVTFAVLVAVALVTAVGLVWLWPDSAEVAESAERASYAVAGVSYEQGEVLTVSDGCADAAEGAQNACQQLGIGVRSGPDTGQYVDVTIRGTLANSGIRVGDDLELVGFPLETAASDPSQASRSYELANTYEVSGIVRHLPLALLALVFAAVVVGVGRLRGFFALIALGVAAWVLLGFVLPALVAGGPALAIGLVGSSAIMFVTLFFVHGPNMRTTSALIGTLAGILIISSVSWISVRVTRLSGLGDEASGLLSGMVSEIDFRGLLTCSILIAGLGVLNDVTITQASSVWELRAAAPHMSRREIYARAMRIGRDHIASTVYTVFFAYAGAALSVLILLYLYDRPVLSLLTQEDIAIEIVRTLAGSIGLVLSVPITTAVAAIFVPATPMKSPGAARRAVAS